MADTIIDQYDHLLRDDGPAAIVLTRKLKPVEGKGSWIFPPTFAQSESSDEEDEGRGGAYQIDVLPNDDMRKNVCLIDSVGSQANRIEPIFKQPPYAELVPQYHVKMSDGGGVHLLDVGHRAADAAIRFSKTLGPKLWTAFKKYRDKRDPSDLAKLAPTSLVFGVWDSRATGAKIQRIVRSVIRGYNVAAAKRSATYQTAYDYTGNGVISPDLDKGTGKNNSLSQEGLKYSLATGTHGGVLVKGDLQQEAIINLVALRLLTSDVKTKRYLLALALVGLSYRDQQAFNLREGCLLCADSPADLDGKWSVVNFDGTESSIAITHKDALEYAQSVTRPVKNEQSQSETDTTRETSAPSSVPADVAENTQGEQDKFLVEQPAEDDNFDQTVAQEWIKLEKKERKVLAKRMHPSAAIAERRKKEAATDPIEVLRKLVDALTVSTRDKFNKGPREKLDKRLTEIEGDSESSHELKSLASKIKPLLTEEMGAAARKSQMLNCFSGLTTGTSTDTPADVPPESTEEAPQ